MVSRVGAHVPGSFRGHTHERAVPDGLHDQGPPLTRVQLQRFTFRPENDTTLEDFNTDFSEIFSKPMLKQFADFEAAGMRDKTPRAFYSSCKALISLHQVWRQ